jgi:galactokinase
MDALVTLCNDAIGPEGGARMTGGGFGGCVVALLPHARVPALQAALNAGYRAPNGAPAVLHRCQPTAGAGLA